MRAGIRKEIDWEYLGSVLAGAGDEEQTIFFKSFVKECRSWGTNYQVECQLAAVNLALSEDERYVLKMLGYSED